MRRLTTTPVLSSQRARVEDLYFLAGRRPASPSCAPTSL